MKYIIAVFILLSLSSAKVEEEFYVTFISKAGGITYVPGGKAVQVGDALNAKVKLKFEPNVRMSCISPSRGTFQYDNKGIQAKNKQNIIATLKEMISPGPKLGSFKTRSLDFKGYDAQMYFQSNETQNKILLIKGQGIPIEEKDNQGKILYFIQFEENGKTIIRKIPFQENRLMFDEKIFERAATNQNNQSYMLCIQRSTHEGNESEKLAEFIPVFADKEEIEQQINILKKYANLQSKEETRDLIMTHLYNNYGKIGVQMVIN